MVFAIKWVECESSIYEAKPLLGHCIHRFPYVHTHFMLAYMNVCLRDEEYSHIAHAHLTMCMYPPNSVVSIASFCDRTIINNNPQRLPESFIRLGTAFDSSEFDMAHTLFRAHLLAGSNIYEQFYFNFFPISPSPPRSRVYMLLFGDSSFLRFVFLSLPSVEFFFCARFYFYTRFFFCL